MPATIQTTNTARLKDKSIASNPVSMKAVRSRLRQTDTAGIKGNYLVVSLPFQCSKLLKPFTPTQYLLDSRTARAARVCKDRAAKCLIIVTHYGRQFDHGDSGVAWVALV